MRQLFFLSSHVPEFTPIHGANWHVWSDDQKEFIGVVEMNGNCDAERVIANLEAQGIEWLPNHLQGGVISKDHALRLAKHGVAYGDTTFAAMSKVHAVAGFPHLRPKRF